MAVTIEELYRNYGILADAKDNLKQVCALLHFNNNLMTELFNGYLQVVLNTIFLKSPLLSIYILAS